MTEIKVGQYWRTRGGAIHKIVSVELAWNPYPVVSRAKSGDMFSHTAGGRYFYKANYGRDESQSDLIEHLPDCTGFDLVPKPVEAQDDWVEITDQCHVLRPGDEMDASGSDGWIPVGESAGKTVGRFLTLRPGWRFRCRRKGRPHKKQRVRLWAGPHGTDNGVRCVLVADSAPSDSWTEVLHDADGFYFQGGGG